MFSPSKKFVAIAALVAGSALFSHNFKIAGLEGVTIRAHESPDSQTQFAADTAVTSPWQSSSPTGQLNARSSHFSDVGNIRSDSLYADSRLVGRNVTTLPVDTSTAPSAIQQHSVGLNDRALPGNIQNIIQASSAEPMASVAAPQAHLLSPRVMRLGSFCLDRFGQSIDEDPFVTSIVSKIVKQFDVIALQGIVTEQRDLIPKLLDKINASALSNQMKLDYLIGPPVGTGNSRQQLAFIFNAVTIETDRDCLYTLEDPDDLLTYEPLVGWFRCRSENPTSAFTFTMINFAIANERFDLELKLIPDIVQSIVKDGRNEDDAIVVGPYEFGANTAQLSSASYVDVMHSRRSHIDGSRNGDYLFMLPQATVEYLGRANCIDFLRLSNLTLDQAARVSEHLPVWAEFSTQEGKIR